MELCYSPTCPSQSSQRLQILDIATRPKPSSTALPNIFLTDFALDKVLEKERKEPNNAKRFWPTADLPELQLLAEQAQLEPPIFTLRGFVTRAHANQAELSRSTDGLIRMITAGLESARSDPAYVAKARNIPPSDQRPRTLLILGELLRGFNLDPDAPISGNDVIDLLHAAMPVNCCDYVLLDGPWVQRVEKMKHRIAKTSMRMPIANCFSQRDNGVEAFLADLESFDKADNAADAARPM